MAWYGLLAISLPCPGQVLLTKDENNYPALTSKGLEKEHYHIAKMYVLHPLCHIILLFSFFTQLAISRKVRDLSAYDPGPAQGFFLLLWSFSLPQFGLKVFFFSH